MFDLRNPKVMVRRSFFPGTSFYLKKWQAFILDCVLLAFIVSLIGLFIVADDYAYAAMLAVIFIVGYVVGKFNL